MAEGHGGASRHNSNDARCAQQRFLVSCRHLVRADREGLMACEKCWGDAYLRMLETGKAQTECYHELLAERVLKPCSKSEQEGQFSKPMKTKEI